MKPRTKKLTDQVMVITGATSGIGLATARMAAARGAKLVLVARNEPALVKLTGEIGQAGGEAINVVADVADADAMLHVAEVARQRFGGFDTWINNAGISIYGRLEESTLEEKRRVFDVNFWGVVHGCRAAVRHLRGHGGGTIINIGSVVSERAIPLQGIYTASKHAVKGYTDALRMELEEEGAGIAVTLIKPASIDTPYTWHARNKLGRQAKHIPPVYAPEVVAKAILACAERPRRDLIVGGSGKVFSVMEKFFPRLTDRVMERTMFTGQTNDEPEEGGDSLFGVRDDEGQAHGNRRGHVMRSSLYTEAALHPLITALVAAGVLAIGWQALRGADGAARRQAPRRRRPAMPRQPVDDLASTIEV